MGVLLAEDWKYPLPQMFRIKQKFKAGEIRIEDLENTIRSQLHQEAVRQKLKPGQKIAVAVGSRGIRNLPLIVGTIVSELKQAGCEPFVLAAMGSHGGGTEEGQRQILANYGIRPDTVNAPVYANTNVRQIGSTKNGIPVYFDEAALEADLVVVVNRIKLHTDFVGELQSGLCKMLVIGLGNQVGCSAVHEADPHEFAAVLEEAANIIIGKANIGFGMAIIENGYDQTALVEAVPAETLVGREKELVRIAKDYMPGLMVKEIDVLVMKEIGKNVSGAGFDPNIVGRSSVLDEYVLAVPAVKKMVLLDLTDESHGNGIGVGLFDVITRRVYEKLDLEQMYTNAVACKCTEDVKIPLIAACEEEAVRIAVKASRGIDPAKLKLVRIKNTLELEYVEVSAALLPELRNNPNVEIIGS